MESGNVAAIALLAGMSRRMGENKLLKTFDGEAFFKHTVKIIKCCNFSRKIAVTRYPEIAEFCRSAGISVLINNHSDEGIASSIRLGVKAAEGADGFIFLTGDQPLLKPDTVETLMDAFLKTDKIIVPRCVQHNYSPCIFPRRYGKSLMSITGDSGGRQVYKKHQDDIHYIDITNESEFKDIDSTDDYKAINDYILKKDNTAQEKRP